ncbi:hypothetical protein ACROYT_G038193 [Oculina patagonica]
MEYCESRQIDFYEGDFVCIRVREDSYMKKTRSETSFASTDGTRIQEETNLLNEEPVGVTQLAVPSSAGSNSRYMSENFWVGHCIIKHRKLSKTETLEITMDLHQSASDFPEALLNRSGYFSTLSVIHRSLPHRRMFTALCSLPEASQLVHSICMGHEPSRTYFEPQPPPNLSIVGKHPECGFKPLNPYQKEAVKEALEKPFTLVLGPPGTGKTVTGVHIAYWFAKRNKQLQLQRDQDPSDIALPDSASKPKAPPQVIYCGPSNKSVDVVAKYMLRIPALKIIRVYGDRREQAEFPIPNKRRPLKYTIEEDDGTTKEDDELKAVSLHHVIRSDQCPFADGLREYERKFKTDREEGLRTSDKEVKDYRQLIGMAEDWAFRSSGAQIILCTCAVAGMPRIANSCRDNIHQCIVDECGMCMELESLVPITCSGVKQVVLIGDHKQLQPVIQDNLAMSLGLSVSMFERLSERAKMLELQYRMQKEICKFPSKYFYETKLKTDRSVPTWDPRLPSFWPASRLGKNVPMAFCHVEGEEDSSAIKTAKSNEQSKANEKEVKKVVHVARSLVCKNNVDASKVVILSPYREQRSRISDALKGVFRCKDILVTTITKSQGSEWDYVILSLVRSLSKDELDPEPSLYWLREHLGFLTDEHQMNVGLTRARKGLCVIGNKNLLVLHPMWQELIEFYEENNCLVDESDWPRE